MQNVHLSVSQAGISYKTFNVIRLVFRKLIKKVKTQERRGLGGRKKETVEWHVADKFRSYKGKPFSVFPELILCQYFAQRR